MHRALGVLRSPGEWGADIACGEAQSLGMPLNYGGPGLGYLCCRKAHMRKLPGRIVGATTDSTGQRSFVLTLQLASSISVARRLPRIFVLIKAS